MASSAMLASVDPHAETIPLAELLGALSYALDLTEGQPAGHCIRACWIGTHIGQAIGLRGKELDELYYTVLLKDLGCSSNAARVAQIYLTDDLALKRDFKLVGTGVRDILGFVLHQTGRTASPGKRVAAVANVLRNGSRLVREVIETRCTRGADIARQLRFSEPVASGIYSLDEHWDGSGQPVQLSGHAIPLYSRIALLAQIVDVFRTDAGPEAAIAEARRRSGSWFDPELVSALERVARKPGFWRDLASPTIEYKLLSLPPAQRGVVVDENFLDTIAAAFGSIVDAKSPFTGGHSHRVAGYVDAIAERVGVLPNRRGWLHRGALLHDIGKLGISNALLDKPGPLTPAEWVVMRRHAAHTHEILERVSCLRDLAPVAAAHHERLDGTGYPLQLGAERITLETRIITICDFYDALTADRPYRAALPVDEALAIIGAQVGRAIDPDCYAALEASVA
jgi:HD-GYP domain-containing protein (c-di-GMP phosphodiesterase class II)